MATARHLDAESFDRADSGIESKDASGKYLGRRLVVSCGNIIVATKSCRASVHGDVCYWFIDKRCECLLFNERSENCGGRRPSGCPPPYGSGANLAKGSAYHPGLTAGCNGRMPLSPWENVAMGDIEMRHLVTKWRKAIKSAKPLGPTRASDPSGKLGESCARRFT